MTTSPEKWRVADGRRWKALLCCIYTFFIRYPRFFYIRHDVTTTHDTDRTFHDWASAGRGGGRMRLGILRRFLRLFMYLLMGTRHSFSISGFAYRHLFICLTLRSRLAFLGTGTGLDLPWVACMFFGLGFGIGLDWDLAGDSDWAVRKGGMAA
jgi:hypothetical protein